MNVTRATVGSCVGLPVRSRIADKAWARGMRRETRDARRETRDARRETRDARRETRDARRETRAWAWQRGAWAQCSGFVPKRPKRFMRINSRLSRSACACLCGSTRLVGPWATCCEGQGTRDDSTIAMQNAVSRARRSLTTNPAN
jgi:hypothetical protein